MKALKSILAIAAAAVVASLIAAIPLFHSSFAASEKQVQPTQGTAQEVQGNNNDAETNDGPDNETNDDNGPDDSHDDGEQADDTAK